MANVIKKDVKYMTIVLSHRLFPLLLGSCSVCEIHSPHSEGNARLFGTKPGVVSNGKIVNILAKKKVEH